MIDYLGPDQRWAAALLRAERTLLRCWLSYEGVGGVGSGYDYSVYNTTSSEEPAFSVYAVAVRADVNGVHVSCDCPAGMQDRPCKHAARVLNTMGHLPNLPQGYTGGAISSTWGYPVSRPVDGAYSRTLLNGEID